MSYGYRRIFGAIAGLVFLCAAQQPDQGNSAQRAAENTTEQMEQTEQVSPTTQEVASPSPKPNLGEYPKDQAYYDHEDLKAQSEMSKWTRYMGIAAIIGVVLSLVGVGLIYTTFVETRRTANESRRSVDTFVKAEDANPNVTVSVRFYKHSREYVKATFHVTNLGRSAAKIHFLSIDDETVSLHGTLMPGERCSFPSQRLSKRHAEDRLGHHPCRLHFTSPITGRLVLHFKADFSDAVWGNGERIVHVMHTEPWTPYYKQVAEKKKMKHLSRSFTKRHHR